MSNAYAEAEVVAWLEENLPAWRLEEGFLARTYTTGSWQLTLLLANAIGYLAEVAWHHPELILSYPRLTVRLQTHDAGGITDKDFELARRVFGHPCEGYRSSWQRSDSCLVTMSWA
jgi:4a-hydroxytetrahydrobiopterin dehydratase